MKSRSNIRHYGVSKARRETAEGQGVGGGLESGGTSEGQGLSEGREKRRKERET